MYKIYDTAQKCKCTNSAEAATGSQTPQLFVELLKVLDLFWQQSHFQGVYLCPCVIWGRCRHSEDSSHTVLTFLSWFRSHVTHLILERKSYIAHNVPLVHCTSDWILQLCNNWPSQLITCWLKPISSCPNPSQPSQTIPTHQRASQIRQLQLDLILTLGLDAEVQVGRPLSPNQSTYPTMIHQNRSKPCFKQYRPSSKSKTISTNPAHFKSKSKFNPPQIWLHFQDFVSGFNEKSTFSKYAQKAALLIELGFKMPCSWDAWDLWR